MAIFHTTQQRESEEQIRYDPGSPLASERTSPLIKHEILIGMKVIDDYKYIGSCMI